MLNLKPVRIQKLILSGGGTVDMDGRIIAAMATAWLENDLPMLNLKLLLIQKLILNGGDMVDTTVILTGGKIATLK